MNGEDLETMMRDKGIPVPSTTIYSTYDIDSTTGCEVIKRWCNKNSVFCEYATGSGYCRITACLKENNYIYNKINNVNGGVLK